jgi:hypothetical protein
VEEDEEGDWWCEGNQVRYEDICFSYLTTDKVHSAEQPMRAQFERDMEKLTADAACAYEAARKLKSDHPTKNSGLRDSMDKAEVRAELAFLALTVEAPLLLLEAWRTQMKNRA